MGNHKRNRMDGETQKESNGWGNTKKSNGWETPRNRMDGETQRNRMDGETRRESNGWGSPKGIEWKEKQKVEHRDTKLSSKGEFNF